MIMEIEMDDVAMNNAKKCGVRNTDLLDSKYELYFTSEIKRYDFKIKYKEKKGYELFTRMIDLLVAVFTCIPISIIIAVTALVIICDSPGNPFFVQKRVGRNGKIIKVHKLRSMRLDAERNGQKWADVEDPRITRVGSFIRKHRIDELPQFYDILIGNMSLVGPRPEVPSFTVEFNEAEPGFVNRLLVKPGLSGWAQVNGGYDIDFREKLKFDVEFIENRNLYTYFNIWWLTILTVFSGDGAR